MTLLRLYIRRRSAWVDDVRTDPPHSPHMLSNVALVLCYILNVLSGDANGGDLDIERLAQPVSLIMPNGYLRLDAGNIDGLHRAYLVMTMFYATVWFVPLILHSLRRL